MGVSRYELTEVQWRRIERLLPARAGTVGRPALDNRLFVRGVAFGDALAGYARALWQVQDDAQAVNTGPPRRFGTVSSPTCRRTGT